MNTNLLDFLVKTGLIGPQQARAISQRQQQMGGWLVDLILESCQISDVDLARALGQLYQLNVIDIARVHPRPAALHLLPREVSQRHCTLPFSFDRSGDTLLVAIADPDLAAPALDSLRQAWPKQVQIFIAPKLALQSIMEQPISQVSAAISPAASAPSVSFSHGGGRSRGHSSFSGLGRAASRPDLDLSSSYDTGNNPYGWGGSPSHPPAPTHEPYAQALDALRASVEARLLSLPQLEQRLQQLEARASAPPLIPPQLDQHLQRVEQRLQQVEAKQSAPPPPQPPDPRLQQLERSLQAQLSQVQADQQALRLQLQRLEHTLEAEVELLRQLQALLLSSPQTDRKAYLERVAPLR